MRVLAVATPIPGHFNPVFSLANLLQDDGHEVAMQASEDWRSVVEATNIRFVPEPAEARWSAESQESFWKGREPYAPGKARFGYDLENLFCMLMPKQFVALQSALRLFDADVVVADSFYWGTFPLLMRPNSERPQVIHLGITVVDCGSGNNLPEEEPEADREQRRNLVLSPAQTAVNRRLQELGLGHLPCPVLEASAKLADLYLHPGIESFEYPQRPSESSKVRYIGSLPTDVIATEFPGWWDSIDPSKKLVLVSQGTISNQDFGQLIEPTLQALAAEDVLVIATTGKRSVEDISIPIPDNAWITEYLPFHKVLPHVDLLITNGGYGTVNQALSHGVPILVAGLTEDKEEVAAHVQWSGAGIDLRTQNPAPHEIRAGVTKLLSDPRYSTRARELAAEFAGHDVKAELRAAVEKVCRSKGL
jgi:UDP:flavonoid glycosyltransferase YjiC (YdhE family)